MGNLQDGFHFFYLRTGRVVTARGWTNLPIPNDVVKRVNEMGKGVDDVEFRRRDDTVIMIPTKPKPSNVQTELVRIGDDDDDADYRKLSS